MSSVTVAITTTGRPAFLRTALQSVRNQLATSAITEVVVSENSNDRRTQDVAAEFSDLPLRYLFRQPTMPMRAHLFSTFRESRTPYVAILNDDDWWCAGHLASGLRALDADPAAAAYATASLFVADEAHNNPHWIDRSAAVWLFAGQPSWLTTWLLSPQDLLALCWVYTPFHWSSLIARTGALLPTLEELDHADTHTHTIDRLLFAGLSKRGPLRYNPMPATFVRWHAANWVKTQAPETVHSVLRSTVTAVQDLGRQCGWDVVALWTHVLASMPATVELEVLERLRETFTHDDLARLGLSSFFHRRPRNQRLTALRGIAANAKRLVLGAP